MAPVTPAPPASLRPVGGLVTRDPGLVLTEGDPAGGRAARRLSLTSVQSPHLHAWSHIPAAAATGRDVFTEGFPSQSRATSLLFTEGDPARGRGRPLFDSPRAPASPRTSRRRIFDWSPSSDYDDSDSSAADPDSPRFFDSPRIFYCPRLLSEFLIVPPMERARYGSSSPTAVESSRPGSPAARTGTQGARPFSSPRLVAVRTGGRRGRRGGQAVAHATQPDAPLVLHPTPGPSAGEVADAPFVLHPSSGPSAGESNGDFVFRRIFDLYEEYENLSVECCSFKKLCQNPCTHKSEIAVAWKMLSTCLNICQAVRKEIKAAGGQVEKIPYDLLYGEE